MAEVIWKRGTAQYKVGSQIKTSAGVTVVLRGENVSITPFSIGRVHGAVKIEIPLDKIDDVLDAIITAQKEAQKPVGEVRRRLVRI